MQELSRCSQKEAALHREEFDPTVRAIVFGESSYQSALLRDR